MDTVAYSIVAVEDLLSYESVDVPLWDDCGGYRYGTVREALEDKRSDPHYPEVVEALRIEGFTKGVRVHPDARRVTDGHHRIAAAIELGWRYVPFEWAADCDEDSGEWGSFF